MNSLIRPELLAMTEQQLQALCPYFWMIGGAALMMIASAIKSLSHRLIPFLICVLSAVGAAYGVFHAKSADPILLFNNMMVSDHFSSVFNLIFIGSGLVTALVSYKYLDREKLHYAEYYILIFFAVIGMMMMASSLDLIVLFISLEIMSLCVYVLVGFRRADRRSNEAAMKYFVLGSVASAIFLYGVALLYGATGKLDLHGILTLISQQPQHMGPLYIAGAWLVLVGFLFKIAAVPFHMWMPDVYEGAPAPITGFMTTGVKAASFAALLRIFLGLGYGRSLSTAIETHMHEIIWWSAVLTMVVGNLIALVQNNLKRMLAYSSIAHTGYLLIGLLSGSRSEYGYSAMVLYLISYSLMNLGAFGVLTLLSTRSDGGLNLHDLSGLASRKPWLAFALTIFLFSMAGIPPTAGFMSKYYLFNGAVQAGEISLVIIGVLCSAISVYYYLRVLVFMYMRESVGSETEEVLAERPSWMATLAVAVLVLVNIQIGVLPQKAVEATRRAISNLGG